MQKFIRKISIYLLIATTLYLSIPIFFANGKTDPFYLRYTTKRQNNLIIGSSRAAQGIVPQVLNKYIFEETTHHAFFNFSFTIAQSPFGPLYLEAIKKKISHEQKQGFFIIAVNPWTISRHKTNQHDNPLLFRERNTCIGNMDILNFPVNYQYLYRNKYENFLRLIEDYCKKYKDTTCVLHKNGWLEISVNMDSHIVAQREGHKIKRYYETHFSQMEPSQLRLNYLTKTIELLKKHGKVYLVRIPTGNKMHALEKEYMPDFNKKIEEIAIKMQSPYYDYSQIARASVFRFTDGNHLYKKSAYEFTKLLALKINEESIKTTNYKL